MKPIEAGIGATVVKCVVWDLDDTIWQGTLSEDPDVRLRDGVEDVIRELDRRGVLQSIASKNDPDLATGKLKELGLSDYFLLPQFSWTAKSELVKRIAKALNIGMDTLLFIDDSPFERAEVTAETTAKVFSAESLESVLLRDDLPPSTPTGVGATRRVLYQDELRRKSYEEDFVGPRAEFLKSLDLHMEIRVAGPGDLSRASELTLRTNQLNTTGLTFSQAQLESLSTDRSNTLLVISLRDVFGDYGVVGLVLLSELEADWRIRLFLMSCRVMGRNIGGAVLAYLMNQADQRGLRLCADFRHTDVNRQMYLVYRLAGFEDQGTDKATETTLALRPDAPRSSPEHITVRHEARDFAVRDGRSTMNGSSPAATWPESFEALLRAAIPAWADGAAIKSDSLLFDAGLDSLAAVGLLRGVEETFGIFFDEELSDPNLLTTPAYLWSVTQALIRSIDA